MDNPSVGRPEATYSQSQVDEIKKSYEIKLNSMQLDLDDMRKLYQREQDHSNGTRALLVKKITENEKLTSFNLQLMKLYYNKATGKDIED